MPNTPFQVDPIQTAITLAYSNRLYIADKVLPRIGVARQEFKYVHYPIEETMRLPNTAVGRRGRVNEVLLTSDTVIAETADYGLEDPIPQTDIEQAESAGLPNLVGNATARLTEYVFLDHEVRTANLVFDPSNYPESNKIQLAGQDQWSAAHEDSSPLDDLLAGIDACLLKPTHLVLGSAVWLKLRVHPQVVAAIHGNEGTTGIVNRAQVAELLELDELLVGENRLNTAKYGQPAVLGRVWGKHALLFHQNLNADARQGVTFGYTATYKNRVAGTIPDNTIGLRGGVRVRVGESVKELIVAPLVGYLITDAVA